MRLPASGSTLAVVDPIKMHKETIEIEGGRKLYNYSFETEDDEEKVEGDKWEIGSTAGRFDGPDCY